MTLDQEDRTAMEALAKQNDRSLSAEVRRAVKQYIAREHADTAWVSANGKAAVTPGQGSDDGLTTTGG